MSMSPMFLYILGEGEKMKKFNNRTIWRGFATVFLLVVQMVVNNFWSAAQRIIEADHLNNDIVSYSLIDGSTIGYFCWGVFIIVLAIIWIPHFIEMVKRNEQKGDILKVMKKGRFLLTF